MAPSISASAWRRYISALAHFQIMWGYAAAGKDPGRCITFLVKTNVEVEPLTKLDAENAAKMGPSEGDLLDCLIASIARRYGAEICTANKGFLEFLPKDRIRLFA